LDISVEFVADSSVSETAVAILVNEHFLARCIVQESAVVLIRDIGCVDGNRARLGLVSALFNAFYLLVLVKGKVHIQSLWPFRQKAGHSGRLATGGVDVIRVYRGVGLKGFCDTHEDITVLGSHVESLNAFITVYPTFLLATVAVWWAFDRVTSNLAVSTAAAAVSPSPTPASLSSDDIKTKDDTIFSVSVRYPYS
jgi:hypothetical protein